MNACKPNSSPEAKSPALGNSWIQITFTLDTEHYRLLWERAEAEHLTVPGLVRASVIDSLESVPAALCTNPVRLQVVPE